MGRFCHICQRVRANERFSGKGHRVRVCKECARLPRDVREELEILREIEHFLHQSHISPKNRARLQSLTSHPTPSIAQAAGVLLDLARIYPHRRRRLLRLRKHPDFVRRLATKLPSGMWEDYAFRFGGCFQDVEELLPDLPPEDPGPDPEPDEPICWEACEPIQHPFDDW